MLKNLIGNQVFIPLLTRYGFLLQAPVLFGKRFITIPNSRATPTWVLRTRVTLTNLLA